MPDNVLSALEAQIEMLQADYTLLNPDLARQPHHHDVIRTDLTRQLANLTGEIMSELEAGFDETWGLDSHKWNEIAVYNNMAHIVARTSNRVFVGLPLCKCSWSSKNHFISIQALIADHTPPLQAATKIISTTPCRLQKMSTIQALCSRLCRRYCVQSLRRSSSSLTE